MLFVRSMLMMPELVMMMVMVVVVVVMMLIAVLSVGPRRVSSMNRVGRVGVSQRQRVDPLYL